MGEQEEEIMTKMVEPKAIRTVFVEMTNKCNFRCNFCPIEKKSRPSGEIEFELFCRIVDEIREKKISDRIGFHVMGEPLLHPKIAEAVAYAKGHGLATGLTTNGALLRENMVHRLIESGLDSISISLETVDSVEHQSRGTDMPFEAYYERILRAVRILHAESPIEITINMMNTVSRKYFDLDRPVGINRREVDFRKKIETLTGDLLCMFNRSVGPDAVAGSLRGIALNKPSNIWIDKRVKIYVQMLMDWGNAFTEKEVCAPPFGYCAYALRDIGILSDGTVTMCCGDFAGKTALGNIREERLATILASKQAREVVDGFARNHVVHSHCKKCLGAPGKIKAFVKGALSIYLFKMVSHPLVPREYHLSLQER